MAKNICALDNSGLSALLVDLEEVCTLPSRSPRKTVRMRQIVDSLRNIGALSFTANNGSLLYPGKVGSHVVAQISHRRSGHLKPLRNCRAIVICTGSGINRTRQYMALPIV